jgi:hypothetical protein
VNKFLFEKLDPQTHDRNNFDCAEQSLNIFLKLYASQQQKQGFCSTYVCISQNDPNELKTILGYYTVSANSIEAINLDYFTKRKLPYKNIPTIKLGRLARDIHKSSKGFGKYLLAMALNQCLTFATNHMGIWAVEVDLVNESVKPFYEQFGFHEIPGFPLRLLLPMATIKAAKLCEETRSRIFAMQIPG